MKSESTDEAVLRCVGDQVWERFAVKLSDYELASNTLAFLDYYRRQSEH